MYIDRFTEWLNVHVHEVYPARIHQWKIVHASDIAGCLHKTAVLRHKFFVPTHKTLHKYMAGIAWESTFDLFIREEKLPLRKHVRRKRGLSHPFGSVTLVGTPDFSREDTLLEIKRTEYMRDELEEISKRVKYALIWRMLTTVDGKLIPDAWIYDAYATEIGLMVSPWYLLQLAGYALLDWKDHHLNVIYDDQTVEYTIPSDYYIKSHAMKLMRFTTEEYEREFDGRLKVRKYVPVEIGVEIETTPWVVVFLARLLALIQVWKHTYDVLTPSSPLFLYELFNPTRTFVYTFCPECEVRKNGLCPGIIPLKRTHITKADRELLKNIMLLMGDMIEKEDPAIYTHLNAIVKGERDYWPDYDYVLRLLNLEQSYFMNKWIEYRRKYQLESLVLFNEVKNIEFAEKVEVVE